MAGLLPTARTTAAQEIGRVGMYVQSRGERCRGRETEEDWERPEGRRAERERWKKLRGNNFFSSAKFKNKRLVMKKQDINLQI